MSVRVKDKKHRVKSILEELLGREHEEASILDLMEAFEDIIRYELEDTCKELEVVVNRRFTVGDSGFVVEVKCDGKRYEVEVALRIVGEVADVREK